jgi:small ligand-binding sensory domain FIST
MPFAAALSQHPEATTAVGEVVGEIVDRVGSQPDVAVLFLTADHLHAADEVAATVQTLLDPTAFVGASAVAVLGGDRGVEDEPGIALWAARLPGRVTPVHVTADQSDEGWTFAGLPPDVAGRASSLILLIEPFTFPAREFLALTAARHPDLALIGGLASAATSPGVNRLVVGGRTVSHGAVGLLLEDGPAPSTVVSQGCRPIGRPYTVTRSERHVIHELGGRPALERLVETVEALPPDERELAAHGLSCGIVVDDRKLDFARGDFLIRGLLGADRDSGTLVVGDVVPVGATVQFQVRDASTAGEDLELLLAGREAAGALVFTCNGRGTQMFGDAHHDASIIHARLGGAVAGMFCAGEVGPVAGRNALHGFTASVALFHD